MVVGEQLGSAAGQFLWGVGLGWAWLQGQLRGSVSLYQMYLCTIRSCDSMCTA